MQALWSRAISPYFDLQAGVRFAPCIGIEWQSHFGDTRDMIKAAGGETDRTVFVIGVRA